MKNVILSISSEKLERYLNYLTSKKSIKTNHRGQKARWSERRAIKGGAYKDGGRLKGKPLPSFNNFAAKLEDFQSDSLPYSIFDSENENGTMNFTFLCKGMDVLIERDGNVGAISFNTNYLGCRIIYCN